MNRRFLVLWLVSATGPIVAACAGKSTVNDTYCAAGTAPLNGVCVVPDAGPETANGDASTSGSDVTDASIADAAAHEESIADVASVIDAIGEGGPDATWDAPSQGDALGADVLAQPDPCPVLTTKSPVFLECDSLCCGQDPACANPQEAGSLYDGNCSGATCGAGPITIPPNEARFTVRTPNAPGMDPSCALKCSSAGYVYGLGFSMSNLGPGYRVLLVSVGPPWEILGSSVPYCNAQFSSVATGCVATAVGAADSLYVMTKDPYAPARNIEFYFPTDQSTTCSPDGGF
jgi:hypothetical protein